ncbi:heparinase II/III family protein [Lacinutrix sp. C3R15]|uniref:alginate lyase family protein n=1 Tax=Flavobacteriaceae TaxID=49546 RepID=UPI001C08AA97|nr:MULTISPECIES: alginate lyase family protein [Flavobacteriaceae]MBU2938244.1 heparinase II/III family protein [Lacinutrix sp. C3R15]MDO6621558.1 alginate lyase family protein [Oceanihabitans sp. 1_MG-2023]
MKLINNNILKLAIVAIVLTIVSCKKENNPVATTNTNTTGSHPNLVLTQKSVAEIKSQLGNIPVFDATLAATQKEVDLAIKAGIDVPIPKDMAGGYTHSQHTANYKNMQKAGVLFQLLGDEKYAIYVRDMLLEYAKMYPTLGRHPQERSYARGKFFWQCLNDSNWLTYTSQAYDCIYNWLPKEQSDYLNKNLFKPYADFLSIETPKYFNRIHNHSTWGNVSVGMIGLVMEDEELVNRALYGLKNVDIDTDALDNDGGYIYDKDGKAGFLANLDSPFSPDGFYTEGPYYQRYAMYPFMIFAEALQNKKPELKIFEYKDAVLLKAVDALLNLTDADGEFFPLNDGQKGMSYFTASLVSVVDIAYYYGDKKSELLSVAKAQNQVQLDASGLEVAIGLRDKKEKPFLKKSMELSDGAKGDEGAVGILRYNNDANTTALVMKYTGQGLSHGHYDKLSFSLYENGEEVLQDYGLSRFVNVEQKNGGGYLKENKTFAKQTIAHNTITQNETSHFNNDFEIGSNNHSEKYLFDASNPEVQIMSAKETNAYPGTNFHRTMLLVKDAAHDKPFVIDIFKVTAEKANQYDLPYYYFGQIIATSFKTEATKSLTPLGTKNGYQHLWKETESKAKADNIQFTWLNNRKFYSLTSATSNEDAIILARIGANDPEFNLRRDPSIILRKKNTKATVFASIIEPHGNYNPISEKANNAYSSFKSIKVLIDNVKYTALELQLKSGVSKVFILANNNASKEAKHTLKINDKNYEWSGSYYFK